MLRPLTIFATAALAGCAALPADQEVEGDDPYKQGHFELSRAGRYTPSASARAAGEAQSGSYESAGPYDGGRACSGTFSDGARVLGEYLVERFRATSFDGYACRPNTANRSELSMHGTGRAIDLFVPLSGGDADNDLGDPIANWLVENATDLGVQFFIWDRTKWNISYSGAKDRAYGGAHPHHDHLHIELSRAGAAMETAWFRGGSGGMPMPDSPADGPGGPTGGGTPMPAPDVGSGCTDTCPYFGDGECDDGGEGSLYSLCALGTDCMDCGDRAASTPAPSPTPSPSTPAHYAGLDLDGMSIPRAGLLNPTLERTLGLSTEPLGSVETRGGAPFVRGKISWFGGPSDTGIGLSETGAVTGEVLRNLNAPMYPSPAEAARHPDDYYYCAMRWNYAPRGVTWLRSARLLVQNPSTGVTIVVRPVDWGPHTRTDRVIDLSHQSLRALGLDTDDDVLIAWAPPDSPVGIVP